MSYSTRVEEFRCAVEYGDVETVQRMLPDIDFAAARLRRYKDLVLLDGPKTFPGNGNLGEQDREYDLFQQVLSKIDDDATYDPVMLELGSYWALWSLAFRKKYLYGHSVLVDLGLRQLRVGERNFILNGFDFISFWGGLFLSDSGNYSGRSVDFNYPNTGSMWDTHTDGDDACGFEMTFREICEKSGFYVFDLLHMDIQGSELPLCRQLAEEGWFPSKIKVCAIGTHSLAIHEEVRDILRSSGMQLFVDIPTDSRESLGGDGMLCAVQ